MGLIVKSSDFNNGDILISRSSETGLNLETCIDVIELEVLQELFGLDLYDLFILDFNAPTAGEPTAQRFKDVFNPFYDDEDVISLWCGRSFRSEGIKKMLMRFIFVKFSNNQPIQPTSTGHVQSDRNTENN